MTWAFFSDCHALACVSLGWFKTRKRDKMRTGFICFPEAFEPDGAQSGEGFSWWGGPQRCAERDRGKYLYLSGGRTSLRSVVWNPLVVLRPLLLQLAFLEYKNEAWERQRESAWLPEGENWALTIKQKKREERSVKSGERNLYDDSVIHWVSFIKPQIILKIN